MKIINNPFYNPNAITQLSQDYDSVLDLLLFGPLPEQLARFIEVPDNYPEETVLEMIEKGAAKKEVSEYIQKYFKENGVQG